jgi:hypothetical protein
MSLFRQNRKAIVVTFLLAMTFCNVALPLRLIAKLRNGYQDFTIFYTGARLLQTGQAATLYNLATQYRMQQTFTKVPIRLGPLPFNHPPFEALFFVPLTWLGYWPAYLLWTVLNLIMLAVTVLLLRRHFPAFAAAPGMVVGLGATAYFPIAIGIIQGQDIIFLLLLCVLAVICLDGDKDALAGAILGVGLFRPQTVVPLAVIFAVRRWRVLAGFAPVAIALGGVSVALMGWRGPLDYVRFVLHLEGTDSRAFGPEAVPNLRGLVQELPGLSATGTAAHLLIVASSILVLMVALRRIRKGRDSMLYVFSLATATTILINFHALVYDFTLLLPMALLLLIRTAGREGEFEGHEPDASTITLVVLLYLTPLYIFLLLAVDRFFLFSLILLWLYARLLLTPAPAEVPA